MWATCNAGITACRPRWWWYCATLVWSARADHYVPWSKDQKGAICVEARYTVTEGTWNYENHIVD